MLEENTDKENNACKGMRGGGVKYHGLLRNCCNYEGGVKSLEVGQSQDMRGLVYHAKKLR